MLTTDLNETIKIIGTDRARFNDHASKIRMLNDAYDEWLDIYSHRDIATTYSKPTLSLSNFNVSIKGRTHRISDANDERELEGLTEAHSTRRNSMAVSNIELLANVNIDLPTNEIYLLKGKSGAGKTTFLKSLVNCWPFDSGVKTYPTSKDEICFMPQKLYIPPNSTLLEILVYPKTAQEFAKKMKKTHAEFLATIGAYIDEAALNVTDLDKRLPNWSGQLSGGEQQKLAIISAIIKQPKLLIMDEIGANLDPESKARMYNLIKNNLLHVTIIFTDHNPIEGFATKVLRIIDGKLTVQNILSPSQSYDVQSSDATTYHAFSPSNANDEHKLNTLSLAGEGELDLAIVG